MKEQEKLITIVCGGRDNNNLLDWEWFFKRTRTNLVIAGGARGADTCAVVEAIYHHIEVKIIEAEWDKFGKSAGYKRNVAMADYAKSIASPFGSAIQVVAVAGGKGTQHMLDIGENYGFKIWNIEGRSL